jgi:hypothetical protein
LKKLSIGIYTYSDVGQSEINQGTEL